MDTTEARRTDMTNCKQCCFMKNEITTVELNLGYFKVIQHDHFSSTWPVVLNFVLAKYFWRASWTSAQYKTRHSTENTVQGQPESSTWPYGSTWPYQILESWKRVQHDHWIQHSQYSTQPTRKFNMTKGFNMTKPDFRILKKS